MDTQVEEYGLIDEATGAPLPQVGTWLGVPIYTCPDGRHAAILPGGNVKVRKNRRALERDIEEMTNNVLDVIWVGYNFEAPTRNGLEDYIVGERVVVVRLSVVPSADHHAQYRCRHNGALVQASSLYPYSPATWDTLAELVYQDNRAAEALNNFWDNTPTVSRPIYCAKCHEHHPGNAPSGRRHI